MLGRIWRFARVSRRRMMLVFGLGSCGVLIFISWLGQAVGLIPSTEEKEMTRTAEAVVAIAEEETAFALTPPTFTPSATLTATSTITPSITLTPTITFTPSLTATASRTPLITGTMTPSPTITELSAQQALVIGDPLEDSLYEAVETIDAIMIIDDVLVLPATSGSNLDYIVSVVLQVEAGIDKREIADQVRLLTVTTLGASALDLEVIVNDGWVTVPVAYYWDGRSSEWNEVELTTSATQYATLNLSDMTITPIPTTSETYYTAGVTNLRPCPRLSNDCAFTFQVPASTALTVTGTIDGDEFSSSTLWYVVTYNGQTVYAHSSLLLSTQPVVVPVATQPAQQPAGATNIPRPRNCSTAVAMGLSPEQAGQWSHLDRDNDGVACYGT